MSDWKSCSVGELILDIGDGGTPSRAIKENFGGDIPWAVIDDIQHEIWETKETLSQQGFQRSSAKLRQKDSIVLSTGATIGEVGIARVPLTTKQGISGIVCGPQLLPEFFYYKLQSLKAYLNSIAQGSTIREVRPPLIKKMKINIPTLIEEQRAIADILSTLDEAIAQSELLVQKYQSIKQGLISDLLTRGVDENGELRPSYEEAPKLYQETPLGWLPKEWDVKKVDDAFNLILGKMLSKVSKKGKSPFPYLANRNVQWDKLDLSDLDWMDFSDAEREKLKLLPEDLLVCEGGEVGRTAIWNNEMEECYFQKAIHRLRSKDHSVLPRFMLRYMRYAAQRGLFTNFTSQTSISHLTQEKLKTLPVVCPNILEQERIIMIFDNQDELSLQEETALGKLQLLKQGLMQDLLSGQVRVKV